MTELNSAILELYKKASFFLPEDVKEKLIKAKNKEENELTKKVFNSMFENIKLAEEKQTPLCGDTGTPIFFVSNSNNFSQKEIIKAVNKATEEAVKKNYLRPNAVDSLTEKNSGNCLGEKIPLIYFEENEKEKELKIDLILKGGGSENIGKTYSLPDEELNAERNLDGVRKCILDSVIKAQGKGCPPNTLNVVVGGTKDAVSVEAKKLILRKLNEKNPVKELQEFEEKLLKEINSLGIGAMGIGGNSFALGVKTKFLARHPASYFVEISFACWNDRRKTMTWKNGEAKYD